MIGQILPPIGNVPAALRSCFHKAFVASAALLSVIVSVVCLSVSWIGSLTASGFGQ